MTLATPQANEGPGLEDLTGLESSLALVISQESFEHGQGPHVPLTRFAHSQMSSPKGDGNRMNPG